MQTDTRQQEFLPAFQVQVPSSGEENRPLGNYGIELLHTMKEQHSDRYWRLVFDGTLMEKIYAREEELNEMKLRLMAELEKQNPRPRTDSFLAVANHLNIIAEQANAFIKEEIKKGV